MVRDTLDVPLRGVAMSASVKGRPGTLDARMDESGNRYYRVSDGDTLNLFVLDNIYELPVADFDSLLVAIRLPAGGLNSLNYIDSVSVTAQRPEMVDIGYGRISPENFMGFGKIVDMNRSDNYTNLMEFLRSRLGAGVRMVGPQAYVVGAFAGPMLIVVDGMPAEDIEAADNMVALPNVASVVVLKSAPIYGVRGAGGAIIITSKSSW
jgi:hypothetical protein